MFLADKMQVTSYQLLTSVLEYQTWVLRGNFEEANQILASGSIPDSENNNIARFLESQGYKEEGLAVATDPDLRFSLALQVRTFFYSFSPDVTGLLLNARLHHPLLFPLLFLLRKG